MVLKDKEMHVELIHLGEGHTLGDAIAWLPKEGILFAGDSCLTGPYNLLGDAHVGSWIETLSQMDQLRLEILVPGHGKLGTAATVGRQRSYLKHLFDWVTTEKMRDTNWNGIQSRLPELRERLSKHEEVLQYLIAEPGMVPGFSLEAHAKKIFDELTVIRNK
jgi:glyoxylase-like metal-dependent hydrolase (beta-lactamase superfamily II)